MHILTYIMAGKELSSSTRSRICSLRTTANWSYNRIQHEFPNVPRSTIVTTCRREALRGQRNITRPRSGRPRNLTDFDRDMIFDAIQGNPSIKYNALLDLVDHKIGRETLRKLLKDFGLRKWRKIKRPQLTDNDARLRLAWAQRYHDFTPEDWSRVYWSDETSIERGSGENAEWSFLRPKDQARKGEVKPIPLGKQLRQMFWASFSGDPRRTALIPLFGHPDSPRGGVNSIRILETYQQWLPTLIYDRSEAIFMQDGSRTHTAHRVRNWLRDEEFFVMDWPAYSPDLNPIENLWALLKDKLLKMFPELYHMPNSEETRWFLISAAQTAWSQIDPDILRRLSESMPRRVQAIIEAEGWYTTY